MRASIAMDRFRTHNPRGMSSFRIFNCSFCCCCATLASLAFPGVCTLDVEVGRVRSK